VSFDVAAGKPMAEPVQTELASAPGLLGLQETTRVAANAPHSGPDEQDVIAQKHGETLLSLLDDLQLSLLGRPPAGSVYTRLRDTLDRAPVANDERLTLIVDAIRLRSAVEAARLRKS